MLNLITVVYQDELPLLKIQARSIDLYVNSKDIQTITVVVNDTKDLINFIDVAWYGKHQDKVNIIQFPSVELSGWDSQQLYKLLAASQSTTEWNMILDAKTWFVNSLDINKVLDSANRAYHCPAENLTAFSAELKFTESYFDINTNNTIIGPAGVPFMFHTKTVTALMNSIENLSSQSFDRWFAEHVADPPRITEFVLYSVYVVYKYGNYTSLYAELGRPYYLYYNVCDWQIGEFDAIYKKMQSKDLRVLTVSVHRRAFRLLSAKQKNDWLQLLVDKKLVENDTFNINTLY